MKGFYKGYLKGLGFIGALIIRIGFWGTVYHNKEPPKECIKVTPTHFRLRDLGFRL